MAILLAEITNSGLNLGDINFTGASQGIQTGYDTAPQKGVVGTGSFILSAPVNASDTVQFRIVKGADYSILLTSTDHVDGQTDFFVEPLVSASSPVPAGTGYRYQVVINGTAYDTPSDVTLTPANGVSSVALVNPGTGSGYVTATGVLATGDVLEYSSVTTPGGYNVSVLADASFTIDTSGAVGAVAPQTFNVRALTVESNVFVAGAFASQSVTVEGNTLAAPGQVQGVGATPGELSLNVFWNALTANPSITKYTVQWRASGSSTWTSQDTLPNVTTLVLSGLSVQQYEIRVSATNSVGDGPTSNIFQATPGALNAPTPPAPTGLLVIPEVGALAVSFDEVLFTPAVLYYTVEFKPSAFSGWASVQIPGTSVTLTKALHGVEDFIDYDVRVFATNANGDGVRSAIFVEQSLPPQTPQDPTDLEGRGVGVEVIYKPWGV